LERTNLRRFDARVLFITAPPALFVVRLALPGISVLDRIR
jgi:hypothetical protein